jgi:hypothetical protein
MPLTFSSSEVIIYSLGMVVLSLKDSEPGGGWRARSIAGYVVKGIIEAAARRDQLEILKKKN